MNGLNVAIDTNLLLLLVVGLTSRDYIAKHKRLTEFRPEDYDLLREQLSVATEIVITPGTLAETSNLIDHIANPARNQIYSTLRELLNAETTAEIHVVGKAIATRMELPRLGVTDCALLEVCATGTPLITVDLQLYLTAVGNGAKALNFNHIRDQYL